MNSAADVPWWARRETLLALVLVSVVPLLWPTIPPLVDLPGHMGRYRVQLDLADSAMLQQYYDFDWALIGNLGIDLLIVPLAKLFGLELAVKLVVITIPALTVAGMLWIAREVHGEVPPTAFFALPLAYGHPFIFGFVNFALSMALALLAFALWLRLARLGRLKLRAIVFLFIAPVIWVTHTYGWGTLGVLAFSAELVRQHDRGGSWPHAFFHAVVQCLPLAPPVLLMVAWRSGHVAGQTSDWFNFRAKFSWLLTTLRDRWMSFDIMTLAVMLFVLVMAIYDKQLRFSRNLAASALFLLAVYLLLPRIVFGSAYADMRLTPYMIAIALIAIRFPKTADGRLAHALAIGGLAFFLVRTGGVTASFWLYDKRHDAALVALDHVPRGARLISFVGGRCGVPWFTDRMEHMPAMAIVRREAFSNDQWAMAGAQLLSVRKDDAGRFGFDPSQMVSRYPCFKEKFGTLNDSLALFPREAFDYVWLLGGFPFDPALARGLTPVWTDGRDALFRIDHAAGTAKEAR